MDFVEFVFDEMGKRYGPLPNERELRNRSVSLVLRILNDKKFMTRLRLVTQPNPTSLQKIELEAMTVCLRTWYFKIFCNDLPLENLFVDYIISKS